MSQTEKLVIVATVIIGFGLAFVAWLIVSISMNPGAERGAYDLIAFPAILLVVTGFAIQMLAVLSFRQTRIKP
jgi:hypothetical protein